MNVMFYGMVNGYNTYYPSPALAGASATGTGLLASQNSATSALATTPTPLPNGTGATSLMPKWIMPGFSATQIQYMFRHRMDKGAKVNKAVKCETCGITLNSEQQAKQHYSGKNHLKKLRGIGKKKEGKDGDDSDKESENKKFRDKKTRKRDKVSSDDGGKSSENDNCAAEVKDKQDDQCESDRSDDVCKAENADMEKDRTIDGDGTDVTSEASSSRPEISDKSKTVNLEEAEVISSCEADDLCQSETASVDCKSSSQSQNQATERVRCGSESGVSERDVPLGAGGGVRSAPGSPQSPPDGAVVSSCQFTPTSNLDGSAAPSSDGVGGSGALGSSHGSSCNEKSFKLPNGALPSVIGATGSVTPSSSSSSTDPSAVPSSSSPSLSLKRAHSPPTRCSSVHSSSGRPTSSGVVPQKKQRSSYGCPSSRALAGSLEVRANIISSAPHLGLQANSIPGFGALQPTVQHRAAGSQVALLRPVLPARCSTSLSPPSYGAQYTSVRSYTPAALAPSPIGSYPIQYQAVSPSDVASLQTLRQPHGLLSPYYPTALTSPHIQQPMLTSPAADALAMTPDLLTPNGEVLTSDLTSYLQSSKDILNHSMSINYASSAAGSNGLPPGYQYQTLSVPNAAVYQASSSSTFTSTPSPPYMSFSGPKNVSAIPTIPMASAVSVGSLVTTSTEAPRPAGPAPPSARVDDGSKAKLDPVSQAVYDNVLGKLPLKRKKEIPCVTCGLVFNSDAQASAHFAGSKHLKRQKASEEGEPAKAPRPRSSDSAEGDVNRVTPRIPCDVCGLVFSKDEQAEMHFRGAKHGKRLKLEQTKKEGELDYKSNTWLICTHSLSVP